jgi:hypothetical protein
MALGSQLKDSKGLWSQPRTVGELTHQVNVVSTLLLNGKIDMETARVYGALVRSTAQLLGVELGAARIARKRPQLEV